MHFIPGLLLLAQLSTVISAPARLQPRLTLEELITTLQGISTGAGNGKTGEVAAKPAAGAGEVAAKPAAGAGEAKAGEETEGAQTDVAGVFGTAVALKGGDEKQDVLFTKSAIGAFEYEFQAAAGDTLTVTENKTPSAPPAGFEAIEPSSFKVDLTTSKGAGLTLSKIDYIFDPASAGLVGKDVTKAQVGKLCTETNAFVIDANLGEIEFEAEENEVTLNLNKAVTAQGEWGIFLPVVAGAVVAAPAGNATAVKGAEKAGKAKVKEAAPAAKPVAEAAKGTVTVEELRAGKTA